MKKILITTGIFPPEIGGPASYAWVLADDLSKLAKVTVVTYSPVFGSKLDKSVPFRVFRIWGKWPWPLRHFIYSWTVFFLGRTHDQILALNAINAGPATIVSSWFFNKKYFIRIAGDRAWETAIKRKKTSLLVNDFQKVPKRGWIGIIHWFQTWSCRMAQGVIVPSQYLAGIVEGWGIPKEKIHIIYNGVDFKPSGLSKEEARKKLNIPGSLIVSIGRMVPWKGFRMLIKIMPQLLQINQFFRLVIVGDGPDFDQLQSMAKNLGLDKKVFLLGRKSSSELADVLAAADLFILNTGYEGFSHQLLEAMAAGVPVVATNVGGNKELIQQAENGFMVKYNDEFNLIEAIKTLWQMPDLREKFIKGGKESVQKFSVEKMLEQTKKLLNV